MDMPGRILAGLGAAVLVALAVRPAAAAPAAAWAALPDWSGVWQVQGVMVFDDSTRTGPPGRAGVPGVREHPPYNAKWEERYLKNIQGVVDGTLPDPLTYCGIPAGMPRMLNQPDGYEWIVTPGEVWQTTENAGGVRRIFTDGRGHPPDLTPTYNGHSIGRWEGDTLVVETVGMTGEGIIDRTGVQLSDKRTVVERIRKIAPDLIEDQLTITDPEALTAPWKVVKRFRKLPADTYIFDYACAENNRNPVDENGRTITLDSEGKPLHD
jgi:hypothetical protein